MNQTLSSISSSRAAADAETRLRKEWLDARTFDLGILTQQLLEAAAQGRSEVVTTGLPDLRDFGARDHFRDRVRAAVAALEPDFQISPECGQYRIIWGWKLADRRHWQPGTY